MDSKPDRIFRKLPASLLACVCTALSMLLGLFTDVHGGEIGLPLSDPRFSIAVQAHTASKSKHGNYIVYQLDGGVKISQGSFRASCQKATLWVLSEEIVPDESTQALPTSALNAAMNPQAMMHRAILDAHGDCDVQWSEDQRLRDQKWMGRLYSQHEPKFEVQVWQQQVNPVVPLDWSYESSPSKAATDRKDSNVKDAIAWTQQDEQTHLRLASQILQAQPPAATPSVPPSQPLGSGNSMQIGNSTLGGTVLDPGSVPLFESIQPAPQVPNTPPAAQQIE
ncbi:MAG: hypothetical protein ACKO9Q_14455, partial [Pirellula sp.]